jgi:hypothetical protein
VRPILSGGASAGTKSSRTHSHGHERAVLETVITALKPWFQVVTPREDLRDGWPLDTSEFAVHLGDVREKSAPLDYRDPRRFFQCAYLTSIPAARPAGDTSRTRRTLCWRAWRSSRPAHGSNAGKRPGANLGRVQAS